MSIQTKDGKLYLHYDEDGSKWQVLHACEKGIVILPQEAAIEAGHENKPFVLERYGDAVRLVWYDTIVKAFASLKP